MANYVIPAMNDDMEILNPKIVEVTVGYTSAMADAKLIDITAHLETDSTKYGPLMSSVSVESMDYDRNTLFAVAQAELDARYKVS